MSIKEKKEIAVKNRISQQTAIAIHEAAHAAMCLEEKISFKKVSINAESESLGKVIITEELISKLLDALYLNETKKFTFFKKYLKICVAGFVAESKIKASKASIHAGKDFEQAFSVVGKFFASIRTAQAYLNYTICEVDDMYTFKIDEEIGETEDTELWNFIISLSNELKIKRELSYKHCKELYANLA